MMKLLTKKIKENLLKNHELFKKGKLPEDLKVPARFFAIDGKEWFVLSGTPASGSPYADHNETDNDKDWLLFLLADFNQGQGPDLGETWLGEIKSVEYSFGPMTLGVERDAHFDSTWDEVKQSKGIRW
jgi:hypothetical protein